MVMKIADVIEKIAELKPHAFPTKQIVKWLSDLDAQIYKEVVSLYENAPADPTPYSMGEDDAVPDVTLIVPEPYSELYILYVAAQMDFWYGDIARHNNFMIAYNSAYDGFLRWYKKTHMPKEGPKLRI